MLGCVFRGYEVAGNPFFFMSSVGYTYFIQNRIKLILIYWWPRIFFLPCVGQVGSSGSTLFGARFPSPLFFLSSIFILTFVRSFFHF